MTRPGSLVILALLVGCGVSLRDGDEQTVDYSVGTHVVLLGTGTPNAEPDRSGSAVAVIVNGTPYLVDAGPGIVRRAAAAHDNGVDPLRVANLHHLFITHLHTDHTLGLPDLIFTPWVLDRDQPLELYGPSGTARMVQHIHAAFEEDIRNRLEGLEPANPHGYLVNTHEIGPGLIYEDDNVRVTAFSMGHGAWEQSFGFKFETSDRVVVISGDAVPSESIVLNCSRCDVLVHEVYSRAGFEGRDSVWQRYHAGSHTSSIQLAELASRAKPGLLVLYHQLYWGASDQDLLREVRAGYDGRVVSGRDLEVY